jgi:hypothetical protein
MIFIVVNQDNDDGIPLPDITLDREYDDLDEALDDLAVESPEAEVDRYAELCDHEEGCSEDVFLSYDPDTLTVFWDPSREASVKRWMP